MPAVYPLPLLYSIIRSQRALFLGLMITCMAVCGCELAIPWLLQHAIDAAVSHRDGHDLNRIGILLLSIILVLYLTHRVLLHVEARIVQNGVFWLRKKLYSEILHQPLTYFGTCKTGDLMHRVVQDTHVFERHAEPLMGDLPFDAMTCTGVLTLMLITNLSLSILVIGFLLLTGVISSRIGKPLPTLSKAIQAAGAELNAKLQEIYSGIRTVKVFGMEDQELERLDETNRKLVDLELKTTQIESWIDPLFDLMEILGVILVVWYGAHLMIQGHMTPGQLVAFIMYMEIMAGPFSRAGEHYRNYQQSKAVGERISAFLKTLVHVQSACFTKQKWPENQDSPIPGSIRFEDVSFRYPEAPKNTLSNLSFEIRPGDVIAVVGRNGAGKSTLMDLLMGFVTPTSGEIRIGEAPLTDLDGACWRRNIGMLPQETMIFHATAAENITYGKPDATPQELQEAIRICGLETLISRLPEGLDSVLGDRGSRLSGGERQRIALARLFLKQPGILVLDEPTAHLDGEALKTSIAAIQQLAVQKTVLLIEHRPEMLQITNRVFLLDDGRLVASGSHETLQAECALYTTLMSEQRGHPRKKRSPSPLPESKNQSPR